MFPFQADKPQVINIFLFTERVLTVTERFSVLRPVSTTTFWATLQKYGNVYLKSDHCVRCVYIMYACMHYVDVCMYTYMNVYIHTCRLRMYADICIWLYRVWMQLCIYISMHAFIFVCMHVCMHRWICAFLHVCMCAYLRVCIAYGRPTCMHVGTHVRMYACIYNITHVCTMYNCIYVCMQPCVYMYIRVNARMCMLMCLFMPYLRICMNRIWTFMKRSLGTLKS